MEVLRISNMRLKDEREMVKAITQLDPFQTPTDVVEVERDIITQVKWCAEPTMDPRLPALIDYWKDIGNKILSIVKEGAK